jgi:hypothetical protein
MNAKRSSALLAIPSSPTRRAVLEVAAGTGLAALLSWIGIEGTVARHRRHKGSKRCQPGQRRCHKRCIATSDCCGGCDTGQQCCQGNCIATTECCGGCGSGLQCCAGSCVDLATNGAHCGACSHGCATNVCVHGACDCQNLAANCPTGCSCGVREEGGTVCYAGIVGPACTVDTECPLRSTCMVNNFCSVPCLA